MVPPRAKAHSLKATRLTAFALMASVGFYVAFVFVVDQPRKEVSDGVRLGVLLAAAGLASGLPWLRQQLFLRIQSGLADGSNQQEAPPSRSETLAEADSKYHTLTMVTFVLAEVLVLFGVVMAFLSGIPWALLPFALGGSMFMIVFFPREHERDELLGGLALGCEETPADAPLSGGSA